MSYFGSGQKEVVCETFEPQAWRKSRCKNCFKTEPEHPQGEYPRGSSLQGEYPREFPTG